MAKEPENEVKEFVEKVDISHASKEDDDDIIETEEKETPSESSPTETKGDDDDESKKPDELVKKPPVDEKKSEDDEIAVIEGETPRERALRLEVTRLKELQRKDRREDIAPRGPVSAKKELSEDKKKVLAKYKPEDMQNLREVIDVLAEDMGFVRKDEIGASTYTEKAESELDKFLEGHPEYLPENDKDNLLWGRFKEIYGMYKQPENPKDFKKIFDRVHRDVFDIKSAGDIKKIDASKEKIKVASHSGASKPGASNARTAKPAGLRFDMLKGFSDEEKTELENSAGD
jgi:hypothetical protein